MDRKASKGMTAHMGRCVIRREVPLKPVILLRLQGHQFADQDTSNSLHGVHLEASHHAARLHAPIPQSPTMGSTRVSRGTLQVELHLKIRVSLDESHRCLKGSRATPESEPRWMLQDASSHLHILIQLQPVSLLFSTSHPGSLPCTSPSTQQPCPPPQVYPCSCHDALEVPEELPSLQHQGYVWQQAETGR